MSSLTLDKTGKTYWRSLDELADTPEFRRWVADEFPAHADEMLAPSRRGFLKIMAASFALAGLGAASGCRRWPEQKIAPYARRPEDRTPGVSEQYASALEIGGVARPVLVTSLDGRPLKIEGNDKHPASRGAADVMTQASVLEVYDPNRNPELVHDDQSQANHDWEAFEHFAGEHFAALRDNGGAALAVLCEATSSPSVQDMKARWQRAFPKATWVEYESVSQDNVIAGTEMWFGRALRSHLHLDKARVIVSLDADLLGSHPDALRHARDFMVGRASVDDADPNMSRLYVAESSFTLTGAAADRRHGLPASQMYDFAYALWAELRNQLDGQHNVVPKAFAKHAQIAAKDLIEHRGAGLVVAGANLSAQVHAICLTINVMLGNTGQALTMTSQPKRPTHAAAIAQLTQQLNQGSVDTLVILGGNPVYDAPADLDFVGSLAKAPNRIHLSLFHNETSSACTWWLPRAHYLESWGDGRDDRGVVTLTQPLIEPLYGGHSVIELLALISGDPVTAGDEIVQRTFAGGGKFDEQKWRNAVHDGFVAGSGDATVALRDSRYRPRPPAATTDDTIELTFRPDAGVYDGRFANNGWLQELPDPMTKITWDNVAMISPATASKLSIESGDVVTISADGRSIEIAALVMPGQPNNAIAVQLGYGRTHAGDIGNGLGFNVNALRTTKSMWIVPSVQVANTGRRYDLACTEHHHVVETSMLESMVEDRVDSLVREADSLEQYKADPEHTFHPHKHHVDVKLQLFDSPVSYDGHKWGMAIDLNKCIGCNACVVACQAENNIPIVGKEEVATGREMHWIRVDRYFKQNPSHSGEDQDKLADPQMAYQPLTCHHCENAPCEQVCPVAATVHDSEGLNVMVYNRCIGTRYCSNNCPYKVRRFNYFDYHARDPRQEGDTPPFVQLPDQQQLEQIDPMQRNVFNPEVTMRMRGVMEKCTFCTQRIVGARSTARNEHVAGQRDTDRVQDGEIATACQQTCPTQAIVFGDLNDPDSRITRMQPRSDENPQGNTRAYTILDELNVRPRLNYLGRVRNPGGDGVKADADDTHGEPEQH